MSVDPSACDYCERCPGEVHRDWHPTKGQLLEIGKELSRRAQAKERDEIRTMDDGTLIAYGIRLRRMLVMADQDEVPDFLVELLRGWLRDTEREYRWRKGAALKGADAVLRASTWEARVETVKRETDLAMLIAYECANAGPAGPGRWTCSCPFHGGDDTPSLSINVGAGVWHCFGCQAGGDAISYVQRRDGLDFKAAVLELERRLGIGAPARGPFTITPVEVWSDGGRDP